MKFNIKPYFTIRYNFERQICLRYTSENVTETNDIFESYVLEGERIEYFTRLDALTVVTVAGVDEDGDGEITLDEMRKLRSMAHTQMQISPEVFARLLKLIKK